MTIELNINILKACALAASTEQTRYYINSVYVETGDTENLYVATDGHILICVRDTIKGNQTPHSQPLIIDSKSIAAIKHKRSDCERDDYEIVGNADNPKLVGSQHMLNTLDATFPDWRRVVPSQPATGEPGHFNYDLLATIKKASKLLGGQGAHVIHNGENATLVDIGLDNAFAIVMPMRVKFSTLNVDGAVEAIIAPVETEQQEQEQEAA